MNLDQKTLRLYGITDRARLNGRILAEQVEEALTGGVTMIQLREKDLPDVEFIDLAIVIKTICARHGVPLIINDRVNVALASNADGVHVGQSDTDVAEARALLGPDKIIGATAKTIAQAQEAEAQGADYLGSGAIFASSTKKDAIKISLEELAQIAGSVSIPVVAIGGIDCNNIQQLAGAPISGVAVVSAIFASGEIASAARELLAAANRIIGEQEKKS